VTCSRWLKLKRTLALILFSLFAIGVAALTTAAFFYKEKIMLSLGVVKEGVAKQTDIQTTGKKKGLNFMLTVKNTLFCYNLAFILSQN
jgi:hypothetical protein